MQKSRRPFPLLWALSWALICTLPGTVPAVAAELESEADKFSYSVGILLGRQIRQQDQGLKTEALLQGLRDVLSDTAYQLSEEEMKQAIENHNRAQQQQAEEAGRTFLEKNAEREGVTTLPSGLQYEVKQAGDGEQPAPGDSVEVHYHGTLIDGKVFDSSRQRNQPLTISLNNVIEGWKQALPLMKVGDRWLLYIPPRLAYGNRGAGSSIGPNATLIFDVELLKINR